MHSVPELYEYVCVRYERVKLCTLCQSFISSEVYLLSHLRGARHRDALQQLTEAPQSHEDTAACNLRHIVDVPDNVQDPQVGWARQHLVTTGGPGNVQDP